MGRRLLERPRTGCVSDAAASDLFPCSHCSRDSVGTANLVTSASRGRGRRPQTSESRRPVSSLDKFRRRVSSERVTAIRIAHGYGSIGCSDWYTSSDSDGSAEGLYNRTVSPLRINSPCKLSYAPYDNDGVRNLLRCLISCARRRTRSLRSALWHTTESFRSRASLQVEAKPKRSRRTSIMLPVGRSGSSKVCQSPTNVYVGDAHLACRNASAH